MFWCYSLSRHSCVELKLTSLNLRLRSSLEMIMIYVVTMNWQVVFVNETHEIHTDNYKDRCIV